MGSTTQAPFQLNSLFNGDEQARECYRRIRTVCRTVRLPQCTPQRIDDTLHDYVVELLRREPHNRAKLHTLAGVKEDLRRFLRRTSDGSPQLVGEATRLLARKIVRVSKADSRFTCHPRRGIGLVAPSVDGVEVGVHASREDVLTKLEAIPSELASKSAAQQRQIVKTAVLVVELERILILCGLGSRQSYWLASVVVDKLSPAPSKEQSIEAHGCEPATHSTPEGQLIHGELAVVRLELLVQLALDSLDELTVRLEWRHVK